MSFDTFFAAVRRRLFRVSALWAFAATGVSSLACSSLEAADWPGWRGPHRDGQIAAFRPPDPLPATLHKKWSLEAGLGHSSPVVVADRIYQLSRLADQETVSCFDRSGKLVWSNKYPAPYKVHSAAARHGPGPKSTPVVAEGNVYTLGISGILSCHRCSDGELLWQHKFDGKYQSTSPLFGTAMSPLIVGRYCFAHVGGHDGGAFTAFQALTGEVGWTWEGDGPAYTSPIVASLAGQAQLITQTQTKCIGLSGRGRLLWSIPFETEYVQNIVTPVAHQDTVIFSGYKRGVMAYRIQREGDRFDAKPVWENADVSLYMNSPVMVGDRLFGYSQYKAGQLFCLDATSGKLIWSGPPRQGDNAALLVAGQFGLALTTQGRLVLFDTSADKYREMAGYQVADSPTWAHPVVDAAGVLVKDETNLTMWAWKE